MFTSTLNNFTPTEVGLYIFTPVYNNVLIKCNKCYFWVNGGSFN